MDAVGADAHFGSQQILPAVGQARGRVHHHGGTVHARHKGLLHRDGFRQHRFGMTRGMVCDVVERALDAVHHPDVGLQFQILGVPSVSGRGFDGGQERARGLVPVQFDAFRRKRGEQAGSRRARQGFVEQKGFHGIAGPGTLHLGVHHQAEGFLRIRALVHVYVTHALVMFDDRHARLLRHRADQAFAAAGDHEVQARIVLQQQVQQGAVGRRHHLRALLRQLRRLQRARHTLREHGVRPRRLLAAAKDDRVPALEAQGRAVDGHVGARLENEQHHADGNRDARQFEAVRTTFFLEDPPHGIGQLRDLPDRRGDRLQAWRREQQAIHHGGGQAGLLRIRDILGIGGQDRGSRRQNVPGKAVESLVAGGIGSHAQGARGRLGVFRQFVGVSFEVHAKKVIADADRTGFKGQGAAGRAGTLRRQPPDRGAAESGGAEGRGEDDRGHPEGKCAPVGTVYPRGNPPRHLYSPEYREK